ncbi:hypothetical protein [Micromonospora zamorensis]|uniref:hypothetical protein n=1 Tax=Micromonospora zamorensis TaxID=709883 RepID=UPI0033A54138
MIARLEQLVEEGIATMLLHAAEAGSALWWTLEAMATSTYGSLEHHEVINGVEWIVVGSRTCWR